MGIEEATTAPTKARANSGTTWRREMVPGSLDGCSRARREVETLSARARR
jgi:hypothetical protein